MNLEQKCAHAPCACVARASDDYCSDYCASLGDKASAAEADGCGCMHDACTASAVAVDDAPLAVPA